MRDFATSTALVALLATILGGCSATYDQQAAKLFRFAKNNKIGNSPDYYLVKTSGLAGPDRVALVFGMGSDYTFCAELAEYYMEKYPEDRYSCEMANS